MIESHCFNCQKVFFVYPAAIRKNGGKYCSQKCYFMRNGEKAGKTCLHCQKIFWVIPSKDFRKYCSKSCYFKENPTSWNSNPIFEDCLICKKQFRIKLVNKGENKFCSLKCYRIHHSSKKWSQRECKFCHKLFTYRTKQKNREFCSLSCISKYGIELHNRKTSVKRNCLICQKEFNVVLSKIKEKKGKFCSKRCYAQWQIKFAKYDQENFNWKGGVTKLYKKIRSTSRYINWHKMVLERDKFQCVVCNSKDKLETDHIKTFSQIIKENKITTVKDSVLCEELFDINNGRILCHSCHVNTPTYAVMTL